jgi:hypothetical protein
MAKKATKSKAPKAKAKAKPKAAKPAAIRPVKDVLTKSALIGPAGRREWHNTLASCWRICIAGRRSAGFRSPERRR